MSQYKPFFLRDQRIKNNCLDLIKELPTDDKKPLVVKIQPITRSLEQNSKLHALLSDISKQCEFNGKKRDIDTWKMIMVSAHKLATGGQAEMVIGLEGGSYQSTRKHRSNERKTTSKPNRVHYQLVRAKWCEI